MDLEKFLETRVFFEEIQAFSNSGKTDMGIQYITKGVGEAAYRCTNELVYACEYLSSEYPRRYKTIKKNPNMLIKDLPYIDKLIKLVEMKEKNESEKRALKEKAQEVITSCGSFEKYGNAYTFDCGNRYYCIVIKQSQNETHAYSEVKKIIEEFTKIPKENFVNFSKILPKDIVKTLWEEAVLHHMETEDNIFVFSDYND